MGSGRVFHAPKGGNSFLGYRRTRMGRTEVIYDDGLNHRTVWRLDPGPVDEVGLADALERAVGAPWVLSALMAELKKHAISLDDGSRFR